MATAQAAGQGTAGCWSPPPPTCSCLRTLVSLTITQLLLGCTSQMSSSCRSRSCRVPGATVGGVGTAACHARPKAHALSLPAPGTHLSADGALADDHTDLGRPVRGWSPWPGVLYGRHVKRCPHLLQGPRPGRGRAFSRQPAALLRACRPGRRDAASTAAFHDRGLQAVGRKASTGKAPRARAVNAMLGSAGCAV